MAVSKLTAVLGVCQRKGRWEVAKNTSALVVFGRCHVDYRLAKADSEFEQITVKVFCLFGAMTIVVRPGTHVRPSVVNLLASSRCDVAAGPVVEEFPAVVLEVTTLFGRCRVVSSLGKSTDGTKSTKRNRRKLDASARPSIDALDAPPMLDGPTPAPVPTIEDSPQDDDVAAVNEISRQPFAPPVEKAATSAAPAIEPVPVSAREPLMFDDPGGPMDQASRTELVFAEQLGTAEERDIADLPSVTGLPQLPDLPDIPDLPETEVVSDPPAIPEPTEVVDGAEAGTSEPAPTPDADENEAEAAPWRRLDDLDPSKAVDLSTGPTIEIASS